MLWIVRATMFSLYANYANYANYYLHDLITLGTALRGSLGLAPQGEGKPDIHRPAVIPA